tara:strand:- start:833 stop:1126 length:294 start_codon:yes stop_codon:yes gene_type:complete
MTVFMGTRQRYQLARFEFHSKFALVALCLLIGVPVSGFLWNTDYRSSAICSASVVGLAVTSRKGRKVTSRLVNETFYGSLFTVTGVFHTKGATRVGR